MKKLFIDLFLLLPFAILLWSCNSDDTAHVTAQNTVSNTTWREQDPFKKNLTPQQTFELNSATDNVIEGADGTIIVVPKGAFLDKTGQPTKGTVKIQLTEALRTEEMILCNLTTTANGMLLETDGMIHISASNESGELSVDKNKPLYIEIPTSNKKEGMMVYKGTRDTEGNMNWINPKPVESYLQTIDLAELDFLPAQFQAEVEKNIPYKGHQYASTSLSDSLYYSMHVEFENTEPTNSEINLTEPHNNPNKKIINGKYTNDSYNLKRIESDTLPSNKRTTRWGIDPAIIKTIKTASFQNTLIATREFEKRLQVIFQTCSDEVLQLYIDNSNKNLFEIDQLAAQKCKEINKPEQETAFAAFAALKQTKVRNADVYSLMLKEYYSQKLEEVRQGLKELQDKWQKEEDKKTQEAEKLQNEYRNILWKREKYRMERYGFTWTEMGWINIDKGVIPKLNPVVDTPMDVFVKNGAQLDRVYCYIVHENIRSLYRLNTTNNTNFFAGFPDNPVAPIPKKCVLSIVCIGYKGETPYYSVKRINHNTTSESIELEPKETTSDLLRQSLAALNTSGSFNSIEKDLKYMKAFFKENQRRKEKEKERLFMQRLFFIAYPCAPALQ